MSDEEDTNEASVTDFSVDYILETVLKKESKIGRITLPLELSSGRRSFSNAVRQKNALSVAKVKYNEKPIPEEENKVVPEKKSLYPFCSSKNKVCDLSVNKPAPVVAPQLRTPDTPKLSFSYEAKNLPSSFSFVKDTNYDRHRQYEPITPIIRSKNSRLGLCKSTSVLQTPNKDQILPPSNLLKRNCSLDELTPKQNIKGEAPRGHMLEPPARLVEPKKEPCGEPAAEAQLPLANTISVNKRKYLKQKKIGEGGSSKVYSVIDMESWECKAVKVVRSSPGEASSFQMYKDEISILQRLSGQTRIVQIYDFEELKDELLIVMEVGSMDLGRILRNARQDASQLTEFTIKHYWNEMLLAVQQIHAKGIIHLDLKPANFLLVGSKLKLIDFGIASSLQNDQTSILKDSQAGTYNFMSPESLTDVHQGPLIQCANRSAPVIKIGVKSDVWSLGCILYSMVYSKSPFQSITNILQKLTAISSATYQIHFPNVSDQNLLDVLKSCLRHNPRDRPSIEELLKHPYLNTSVLQ